MLALMRGEFAAVRPTRIAFRARSQWGSARVEGVRKHATGTRSLAVLLQTYAPAPLHIGSGRTGHYAAACAVFDFSKPTVSTGHGAKRTTRSATLPMMKCASPVRPCVPMTTRSA